jgi:hypothetical protein
LKKIEAFIRHHAFEPIRAGLSISERSEEENAAEAGSDQ